MTTIHKRWLITLLAACLVAGGAVWAALDASTPKADVAAWVPQGALFSLETPDFARLLGDWSASPEKTAWMKSDDYAVFSRSRLFGRLADAQKEFAGAAGLPVDGDFLKEIAGRQSFFVWYDIGELQIVYLTRLTPEQMQHSRLWQKRKDFETLQSGGVTFYVKSGNAADAPGDAAPGSSGDSSPGASGGKTRTVAFAQTGDWLVLATDKNLMAQTLELMAAKDHPGEDSLARQGWYIDAKAAAKAPESELQMVLNMEGVVKTPQFRSYWIQQNVTEMKQYRSVVANLYRDEDGMREERVLLPKSDTPAAADVDLAQLVALTPQHTVVYRAMAKPAAADALDALQTKVLERGVGSFEYTAVAPVATLDVPQAGSVTDLETRIDEPAVVASPKPGNEPLLTKVLQDANLQAMMTVDRNSADGSAAGLWTPFASAVVLSSAKDWDVAALRTAIQQKVEEKLTAGSLGTAWQPKTAYAVNYLTMNETHGLQMYVSGRLCIVADNEALLKEMLQRLPEAKKVKPNPAMRLAGFDHAAATPGFAQWSAIVDGAAPASPTTDGPAETYIPAGLDNGASPPFFSKDIKGLSDAFASMKEERFAAWHEGTVIRQRVVYVWQHQAVPGAH